MANELAYTTAPVTEPPAEGLAIRMKGPLKAICACTLFLYVFACVKGWLGYAYTPIPSPDSRYVASVSSKSPFFVPFLRTYTVQLASYRELAPHIVFQKAGFQNNFSIAWQGSNKLTIACGDCSGSELRQNQVDSIHIDFQP